MKTILFNIALFFLFNSFIYSQNAYEKIDRLMTSYYNNGVFNGAVLVAEKGKIIYEKAFGLADRELNVPLTNNSKFKIASLSKPFTALAVLQLAGEGKLRLEGTIKDYIPDYKSELGDSITIRQLLTHMSGIRSNLDPKEEEIQQRLHHELREVVSYAESSELMFVPGEKFGYSNFGYNILAYIVQKVSGKPFGDYLKEEIFDPASMKSTRQYDNKFVEKDLVKGYEYKLLYGYQNPNIVDASFTVGAGAIISTVEDLYRFDKALRSEKLLSKYLLKEMLTPRSFVGNGYGWFIYKMKFPDTNDSLTVADHTGSIDGFGAYMARILTDSSFVVVLKNQRADTYIDPAFAPDIGKQIISILYGVEVDIPKKSIANHIASFIGIENIDSAIVEYYRVLAYDSDKYNLAESELNKLGVDLFFKFNMPDEALKIFEVNMKQFPKSYNTYDSYAYVMMMKGDLSKSIEYYKKGLEVLKKYPEINNSESVKKDAEQAIKYITEMEEKK